MFILLLEKRIKSLMSMFRASIGDINEKTSRRSHIRLIFTKFTISSKM